MHCACGTCRYTGVPAACVQCASACACIADGRDRDCRLVGRAGHCGWCRQACNRCSMLRSVAWVGRLRWAVGYQHLCEADAQAAGVVFGCVPVTNAVCIAAHHARQCMLPSPQQPALGAGPALASHAAALPRPMPTTVGSSQRQQRCAGDAGG